MSAGLAANTLWENATPCLRVSRPELEATLPCGLSALSKGGICSWRCAPEGVSALSWGCLVQEVPPQHPPRLGREQKHGEGSWFATGLPWRL